MMAKKPAKEGDRRQPPESCARCEHYSRLFYSGLSGADPGFVAELRTGVRRVPARQLICAEGATNEVYSLYDGWAYRALRLSDGRRQIVSVHVPGDFLSLPALGLAPGRARIFAASEAVLCIFDRQVLLKCVEHSRDALLLLSKAYANEHAKQDQRLTELGQMSAVEATASFILDVWTKLKARNLAKGDSFFCPLTIQNLAECIGITPIHMNRVFRELENTGIVRRRDRNISVINESRLHSIAQPD